MIEVKRQWVRVAPLMTVGDLRRLLEPYPDNCHVRVVREYLQILIEEPPESTPLIAVTTPPKEETTP